MTPSAEQVAAAKAECARLRNQHALFLHAADGRLLWTPLENSVSPNQKLNVLDSAGADGVWIGALHSQLSSTKCGLLVTADIDPLKFPPGHARVEESKQEGQEYIVHDFRDHWPEALHGRFDLVHQRLALAASKEAPIIESMKHLVTLLKPGVGWLQLVEIDTSPGENGNNVKEAFENHKALINSVSVSSGMRAHFARGLRNDLLNVGLIDVRESLLQVPFGAVAPEGLREGSIDGIVSFCKMFCGLAREGGVEIEEAKLDKLPARLEALLRKEGVWVQMRVIWGRKP